MRVSGDDALRQVSAPAVEVVFSPGIGAKK